MVHFSLVKFFTLLHKVTWASTHLRYREGPAFRSSLLLPLPLPPLWYCVAVIAGIQRIDGPLQVKYWGIRTPVSDPAALTPMQGLMMPRSKLSYNPITSQPLWQSCSCCEYCRQQWKWQQWYNCSKWCNGRINWHKFIGGRSLLYRVHMQGLPNSLVKDVLEACIQQRRRHCALSWLWKSTPDCW